MEYNKLLKKIDSMKEQIQMRRPMKPSELAELDNYFRIGSTYSSNALEGNTLTLIETKIILEDGLTVHGKPMRDCAEAVGHAHAYDFMLKIARDDEEINEADILALHRLFYSGIDVEYAGRYRDFQVYLSGTEYIPPSAADVQGEMTQLVRELSEKATTMHPVTLAAFAHKRLVDIHPFKDGNGRTARLLMNLILVRHGYGVVSISPILRFEYTSALQMSQKANNPSDAKFMELIAECVLETQRDYCRLLGIKIDKSAEEY